MTDRPFKVGDRVRALRSCNFGGFIEGETYIVKITSTEEYGSGPRQRIMVEHDSRGSTTNGWAARFFELAERKKSGFGSFVSRIET